MDKNPLEDNGTSLLAQWSQGERPTRKIKIAPDVKPGDCVWLNAETEQYEKVTTTSPFHGIFDGYDVNIVAAWPFKIQHSLLDGQITMDNMPDLDEE